MEDDKSPLHAPRPRTKRKGVSPVRCCIGIVVVFGALICVAIGVTCFVLARNAIRDMRDPHKGLFVSNATIHTPDMVRPLIEQDDSFDVVLGIWVREPNAKVDVSTAAEFLEEINSQDNSTTSERPKKAVGFPLEKRNDRIIYEETVFKNIKMNGKTHDKVVEFNLPTDILQDSLLFSSDVRATITVIPHVADLEAMSNYSDWRPSKVKPLQRLSEDFEHKYDQSHSSSNTLKWGALKHIGISSSLVELVSETQCLDMAKKVDWVLPDVEDEWEYFVPNKARANQAVALAMTSKPYLYTRSHVYMIQESRPIPKADFDKRHDQLRRNSCGRNYLPPEISRFNCHRSYGLHGNWETVFTIGPDGSAQDLRYGPFLGVVGQSAGPKHVQNLLPKRAVCVNSSAPVDIPRLPEFVPVKYEVRFSTMSPARLRLLEDFVPAAHINFTATQKEMADAHDVWEQSNGVWGNGMTGARPYTRLVLGTLSDVILPPFILTLGLLYWATRQTAAGISITGATFAILSWVVEVGQVISEMWKYEEIGLLAFQAVGLLWSLFQIWIIARLILPYEMSLGGGLKGAVRRKEPSHRERASRRIDTGPWFLWLGILLAIWGITYYSFIGRFHLVAAAFAHEPPKKPWKTAAGALVDALWSVAIQVQLVHNQKAKTFAGTYHLVAWLSLVQSIGGLLYHLPIIVGRYEVGQGLGLDKVIRLVSELVMVWQGTKFSRVEQNVPEEEE
ncbi:hypothetical protein BD324DRAFT_647537 [Kockovaella imperatae]|uniref:Uncharacterized protein n=1 Tax=Kockovaella imperatae TaxID=4999 RepID=A0A1Y1UTV0_9TREE|nr:hypothetical protein BD324DRAFT_647537 [Kockovaella imperatae]ORX40615.1 hypothetical protein BD324DRAFT_647537 [Kockovaella imperatae]